MVLHGPDTPRLPTSLYGFVLLCERYYCHLFLLDTDIPEQKRKEKKKELLEMVNERSDEEKEAHWETRSGVRGQGSQGPESDRKKKRGKKSSFPVKFCALDSLFGALCAAANAGEVQQGAGGFLQLLVQLRLRLPPRPLVDGPLDGRRTPGRLVEASLLPEVRVLVAVEALAAGAAGLPAVAASFVQGGQGGGGGAGGAALQGHAAVVVVLLGIAAHQDRVRPGEVQRTVRVA